MLRNFLFRIEQYARENRARLIKWLLRLTATLIALLLIVAGVERFKQWRYEKHVQALDQQIRDADARVEKLEAENADLKGEIVAKKAEARDLEIRAKAAESALESIRNVNVTLKGDYEKARSVPVAPADTSVASVCAQLARLDHPCR
jgi:cell division protein FtsB